MRGCSTKANFEFNAESIIATTARQAPNADQYLHPVFPRDLSKARLHETGLLAAIIVPISNLPALAAHPDGGVRVAGHQIAVGLNYINDSVSRKECSCMACGADVHEQDGIAAIVRVEDVTATTDKARYPTFEE